MRKHFLWLALSTGLGLSACATGRPSAPVDISKACASWRWIGISRPGAQCPDIPGWTVRPLFPQMAPIQLEPKCPEDKPVLLEEDDQSSAEPSLFTHRDPVQQAQECPDDRPRLEDVPEPELIRELNRFCVYEIAGSKKYFKKPPLPPTANAELVRIDQDCAGLSLAERYLEAKSWKTDSDPEELLVQAGRPSEPLQFDNQRGVRLAFLDTQPTFADVPMHQGRSPHGFTLAKIAQELVCSPEPKEQEPYKHCAAQITTQLALPIVKFNATHSKGNLSDREWGGFFGTQSDLALAIRREVDSWLAQRTERSQRHLVLNLSLAWDGKLFGGLNGEQIADMKAGTQAVYRALEYAAGFDVLVLAAAGNQKQEPCVNFGPLLPAAWEEGAPHEKCCNERDDKPKPLLYAVGGVQEDGSLLANARPGGMPRRVAYGKTTVFEGSSVATAIVSSIAAVVWDIFPDRDSRWIMDILDGNTVDQRDPHGAHSLNADFWFRAGDQTRARTQEEAPPVHRLSLCTVLKKVCQENSSPSCPTTLECGEALSSARRNLLERSDENPVANGSCQPWLFPQPEIVPCAACIEDPPKVR